MFSFDRYSFSHRKNISTVTLFFFDLFFFGSTYFHTQTHTDTVFHDRDTMLLAIFMLEAREIVSHLLLTPDQEL